MRHRNSEKGQYITITAVGCLDGRAYLGNEYKRVTGGKFPTVIQFHGEFIDYDINFLMEKTCSTDYRYTYEDIYVGIFR